MLEDARALEDGTRLLYRPLATRDSIGAWHRDVTHNVFLGPPISNDIRSVSPAMVRVPGSKEVMSFFNTQSNSTIEEPRTCSSMMRFVMTSIDEWIMSTTYTL